MKYTGMIYDGKIVEEDGELMLEFSPHLLKQMGWDFGTILEWEVEGTSVILKEVKNGDSKT